MEQTVNRAGRRAGWSDRENTLLWETADEALGQGLPLKAVFDRIATETGRRPNSIRNYYYAQARLRDDGKVHTQRFIPFEDAEVRRLMEHVLRDKAQGRSVRSSLQRLAGGDHSLMLRYQNKYRSVVKTRPELVREIVDELRAEGVEAREPEVGRRAGKATLDEACARLTDGARRTGEAELVQACETLTRLMLEERAAPYRAALDRLSEAAQKILAPLRDFLASTPEERANMLDEFAGDVAGGMGALEECLSMRP